MSLWLSLNFRSSLMQLKKRKILAVTRAQNIFTHPLSGLLCLLIIWHVSIVIVTYFVPLADAFLPMNAFYASIHLLSEKSTWLHFFASFRRIFLGLLLALCIGIPVGLWVGLSPAFERLTSGAFHFLRMISPLSWMPIAVMIFGIGDFPIVALLTFAAVWPLIINTATGVRSIDPAWLMLGKSMKATKSEQLHHIILPAVIGNILTGLRLSLGVSWIVLVPCEMLGVSSGLGYFILDTRDRLAYNELSAAIVFVGLSGWLLDASARYVCRRCKTSS